MAASPGGKQGDWLVVASAGQEKQAIHRAGLHAGIPAGGLQTQINLPSPLISKSTIADYRLPKRSHAWTGLSKVVQDPKIQEKLICQNLASSIHQMEMLCGLVPKNDAISLRIAIEHIRMAALQIEGGHDGR
jgi:hypothetical protein